MRATNISNVGARCVSLSPLGQRLGADHRLLRHSGGAAARARGLHQHHADPGLSQLGPARSDLRDRAHRRYARRRRCGIDRVVAAPTESRARRRRCPIGNAVGMLYDSGTYEANMDPAMRLADWDGSPRAAQGGSGARAASRAWPRQLRRILDRRAEGARRASRSARSAASMSSSAPSRPAKGTRRASRR